MVSAAPGITCKSPRVSKGDTLNIERILEFPGMSRGLGEMDMKKLESLSGNEFDLEFIQQMILHHEGAIEMAKTIQEEDGRPEVKELATDIITAQETEITQMKAWLAAWSQ